MWRACGLLVREHGVLFLKLTGDKFCFGDVLFEEVQAGASSHPKTSQVRTECGQAAGDIILRLRALEGAEAVKKEQT